MYTRQSRQSSQIAWGQLTPPKRDPASLSCKSLPASIMPTSKDLLPGNICLGTTDPWGLLTPGVSQSVRGQENIMLTRPVTMRDQREKTLIESPELGLPSMEIDSRTIKYNHYNRLGTIYSPVRHNYRRTLRKWT